MPKIDKKRPIFANIEVNFFILFVIRFVYLIFIFTTTMPFKLIYFYPRNLFMFKVTETYFGRKLEILRIFVEQFTYEGCQKSSWTPMIIASNESDFDIRYYFSLK